MKNSKTEVAMMMMKMEVQNAKDLVAQLESFAESHMKAKSWKNLSQTAGELQAACAELKMAERSLNTMQQWSETEEA